MPADEFPLDAFDIVPGYGDDTEVPPYPDDELEPLRKRGVPRSLVTIAGILALVLIGVLAFVMLRPGSSGSGAPPIISADAGPTKIAPPEPPSTGNGDQQNKLIYDRVDSGASAGPADTKLVTPGSEPIAPVPSTDTNNPDRPGDRCPADRAPKRPGAADAGTAATMSPWTGATAPSRSGRARCAPWWCGRTARSCRAMPRPPRATLRLLPTRRRRRRRRRKCRQFRRSPTNDDTAAIAGGTSGQELAITTNPAPTSSPTEAPAPPAAAETHTPAPMAPPTPKPTPTRPKVVATGGDGGPIDLTPGTSNTQVASRTSGGQGGALPTVAGGMMVQVSSQRSEDAARATFRDLQARYASILGGYDANIQRADLGNRGTYFRVRVGPFTSADAQNLCSQLKNAGGDCILAKR